ncbi:hisitidine kinase [Alkalihalobacillus alcalophilus ATCC 27647 = CGMCC 1.3604]|uniref:Hisitidine kinase n=1 Tax=Alkalihalobacillus alcalophilus ATCC 27647 = CGMCC 1.3604 TaxID=1218173 RepID=A0A094WJI4_ALKAL|nr:CD3324 family protein [Alkalihalobacillus alcalophilus]KGA97001.1 histidine kinase [Alkalihalobacillus alcalophilus ATCC 27647 = CGMCC 1.3604]MED1564192.1 CD3324 family protein [Alkalihalobacillus alcalophilus]THG90256.1 hisitidine kinase [Alkalihalobacillus alcalophilus ATCC 27647 = CGMCC 1.3604]
MSYMNAEHVLPKELIKKIQQYVDGKPLYIPRKNDNKKSWGENNGTRRALKERNVKMYFMFLEGATISELAVQFFLSEKSVRRIIRQEKIKQS